MPHSKMVNGQVITVGVTDRRLIAAMLAVPRKAFVPPAMKPFSHIDSDLRVRERIGQSPPRFLMSAGPFAKLVQEAKIGGEDTVLDVGCATGYSSAVLARLAGFVVALECDAQLAALAHKAMSDLDVQNVAIVTGPLELGWPERGPYDVIFIGGSVERIPDALVSQLKDGGRLTTIMGNGPSVSAQLYVKSGGALSGREIFDTTARPLPGFEEPRTFVL